MRLTRASRNKPYWPSVGDEIITFLRGIKLSPDGVILWLRRLVGLYMFWLVFYPYQFEDLYPFFIHAPFILLSIYWVFAPRLSLRHDAWTMAGALVLAFMPPVLGYVSMPISMLRPLYAGYMAPVTEMTETMYMGAAVGMWLRIISLLGFLPLGWSMARRWGAVRGGVAAALMILLAGSAVAYSLVSIPLVFVSSVDSPPELFWPGAEIEWTVTLKNRDAGPALIEGLVVEKKPILSIDLKHSDPSVFRVVSVTSGLCLLEWDEPLVLGPGEERQVSLLLIPLEGGDYRFTARVQASGRISLPADPFAFQVLEGAGGGR